MQLLITNWRETNIKEDNTTEYTCWIYRSDEDQEIENWMKDTMVGNWTLSPKFNSGTPIFICHIENEQDAMLFKLKYNEYIRDAY